MMTNLFLFIELISRIKFIVRSEIGGGKGGQKTRRAKRDGLDFFYMLVGLRKYKVTVVQYRKIRITGRTHTDELLYSTEEAELAAAAAAKRGFLKLNKR